jgi:hypothetical protein
MVSHRGGLFKSTASRVSRSSGNLVVRAGRLVAVAAHQPIEFRHVYALTALGEERCRIHRGELLGYGGRDELVDADASAFARRSTSALTERGSRKGLGVRDFQVTILGIASAGVSKSIPNRTGAAPKSGRLHDRDYRRALRSTAAGPSPLPSPREGAS